MVALLAATLAISDSASALNVTIGNSSQTMIASDLSALGQSFINDPSGTGASILLNDWTFAVEEFDFSTFTSKPLSSAATLNIYAGTGINGTLIGSATTYDSTVTLAGFTAAKWAFAGGLSLIDNQTYTAAVISPANDSLGFKVSDTNPYPNGYVTRNASGDLTDDDTVFTANFSAGAATAVPFEFEATGGLGILGGAWLLRRHLQKRAKKA